MILRAVRDTADVGRMRALGFCVSIGHAEFMADWFTKHGVPSAAVTSGVDAAGRQALLTAFRNRELRALFTVDLFNGGVDLPMVDTILMLRPSESATIFLQQLGRGLRLDDDKPCLTVLDFIGGQHANFRFDLRWRALTGVSRRAVEATSTTAASCSLSTGGCTGTWHGETAAMRPRQCAGAGIPSPRSARKTRVAPC